MSDDAGGLARALGDRVQRELFGNRRGVADLVERGLRGETREERKAATEALADRRLSLPKRRPLPDGDAPGNLHTRRLGLAVAFAAAVLEIGEQAHRGFGDRELDQAFRNLHARLIGKAVASREILERVG